jgi:sortase A
MKPNENDDRRMGTPLIPQRSYISAPPATGNNDATQAAAANIVRSQLDSIYSGRTATPTPQTTPVASDEVTLQQDISESNPYERTQTNPAEVQAAQWKQYHSAWQDYYQKYYERYYVGQVYRAKQVLEEKATEAALLSPPVAVAAAPPTPIIAEPKRSEQGSLSRDEALYDLRSKLLDTIQTSAKKARKSRHFVPISAALAVVLVFLFLQYNRVLFANVQAYISPGSINPANIIVDPSTDVVVSQDPKLIIPKINVDVPVDYSAGPDYNSQMDAMKNGVAYFGIPGANSKPGQIGNTVIAGHSSNDVTDPGDYKFIFARLDALTPGDTIYINYLGKRYVYSVTKKEVVKPTDIQALIYTTNKPVITLLTCTPIGTALNRLLVTAEQISPSPSQAAAAPSTSNTGTQPASIPGNSPTFMERIFGGSGN